MHPLLKKIVRLASMECKSESTATIETFWDLFNQMLRAVGKKEPSGISDIYSMTKLGPILLEQAEFLDQNLLQIL